MTNAPRYIMIICCLALASCEEDDQAKELATPGTHYLGPHKPVLCDEGGTLVKQCQRGGASVYRLQTGKYKICYYDLLFGSKGEPADGPDVCP